MFLDKTEYQTSLDLSLYIEGLLNPEHVEKEVDTEPEQNLETMLLNDLSVSIQNESVIKTKTSIEIEQEVEESIKENRLEKVSDSNIPLWGQEPFKCLKIKIADMDLMIPAMSVSFIERINKKIIRLPLETDAFRGVVTLRNRSVAVIDLHKTISSNAMSYNQNEQYIEECHVEYVIVMEDGAYALACDEVGEMTELSQDDVRWNKASFNNPMFAGIVPDKLCAIVNIENLQKQIAAMPFVQSLNSHYKLD